MTAPLPADEDARLAALRGLEILDTPPDTDFDDIVRLAAQICGTPISAVSLIDADRQWFKSRIGMDATETAREMAFCAHTILQTEPLVVNDTRVDARFADNPLVLGEPHIRFYAGAPLCTPQGEAVGALCVIDQTPRTLSPDQRFALRVLSRNVSAQMELRRYCRALQAQTATLARANAELVALATNDSLTGLKNHRNFHERLAAEAGRATRYGTALSLLMLDVDDFKRYNDAFGHPAGDARLRALAQMLTRLARDTDIAARWGGDEFALLLPYTGSSGALTLAERLRRTVETGPWPDTALTVSLGVATLRPGTTGADLVAGADRALNDAKARGRNRVSVADILSPGEGDKTFRR